MRKILLALALAAALLAGSAATAGASPAAASKPTPLPVLYNLGGADAAVWNNPQVKPAIFYIFADGSGAVIGMRWARWNHSTAVTSKATDYSRTGPCCTKSDQHYQKVTVTLSHVRYRGGPRPGPYFTKMVITGRGFRTLTYTYKVFRHGSVVIGAWIGGAS
jgi:poly(3-hydroxybutyrate) depolymerase